MIKIKTLDCGVKIVMEKVDYLQSAAVGIWVKAGSVDENEKYSGISHFIEHMMFKGTSNRTAKQIAEDIDRIGGQINAFTSKEATCYYVKSISQHLFTSMEVLVDMITESLFSREELNRERNVILEEIKMFQDAPDDIAYEMITEIVNKDNPAGRNIIGTPTSLKRITRNVMTEYYNEMYTRDNIIISVAGNFDEDEVCKYIEGKFSKLKESSKKRVCNEGVYVPGYRSKVKDIEQSHIYLGTRGCKIDDENYYNLSVLSNILGGNMSSRLFQSVREQKGLAYSVYSAVSAASFTGSFYIYAGVAHDKVSMAVDAIKDELRRISSGDISDDELQKAKEQLKVGYIFGHENILSKMLATGRSLTLTGTVKTDLEVIEGIEKVSLEDVNKMASKICDISGFSAAVVSDRRVDIRKMMEK